MSLTNQNTVLLPTRNFIGYRIFPTSYHNVSFRCRLCCVCVAGFVLCCFCCRRLFGVYVFYRFWSVVTVFFLFFFSWYLFFFGEIHVFVILPCFFNKTVRRVILAASALFTYDSLCFFVLTFIYMITCGSCFFFCVFSCHFCFCLVKFVFFVFLGFWRTLSVLVFLLPAACLLFVRRTFWWLHLRIHKFLFVFLIGVFCLLLFFVWPISILIFTVWRCIFFGGHNSRFTQFFLLSVRFLFCPWAV